MKHSVGLFSVLILMLLTSAVHSQTISPDAQTLRDLLSYPTCQRTCFMGIEPSVTTQTELETVLDQNQLEFTHASIASGHLILYTVVPSPTPFLANDKPVYIDVTADHVDLMTLFLQDVTVAQITASFGTPDAIASNGGQGNLLLYVDEGLIFTRHNNDSDVINTVMLTSPGRDARRMSIYLANALSCNGSLDGCAITTATPTPIFTPSATIPSEGQAGGKANE